MFAPLVSDCRIKRNAHRHRIRQRDAVLASLLLEGFARTAVALNSKSRHRIVESENARNVGLVYLHAAANELPFDGIAKQKAAYLEKGGSRSNAAYGYMVKTG